MSLVSEMVIKEQAIVINLFDILSISEDLLAESSEHCKFKLCTYIWSTYDL